MPTVQFAWVPILFTGKGSEVMHGNQPIFMQSLLTFFQRQRRPFSDLFHISIVKCIRVCTCTSWFGPQVAAASL